VTLWTFWQNAAQIQIYGSQANTLVDNAGVIQAFGVRNRRMAQDFANLVGSVAPDDIMNMPPGEQILLIEGKTIRCRQPRYYDDAAFASTGPLLPWGRPCLRSRQFGMCSAANWRPASKAA